MKRMTTRFACLAAIGALMGAQPAAAQYGDAGLHAGSLEVPVNKSQVVSADRAIARAMIGNPEIADVLPISERSVYVLGKTFGTTSLTLYDRANRVIAVMDIEVGPDVEALRGQLTQLVPGQPVDARISAGSIMLTGMVSDAGSADRAAQIAKAYAGEKVINLLTVGGSQQVMLEVKFAEVTRNIGEQIGLRGVAVDNNGKFIGGLGEGTGFLPGTSSSTTTVTTINGVTETETKTTNSPPAILQSGIEGAFSVFSKSFGLGGLNINATLDMLERKGLAKTLAEPTLVAISGEKASFLAGGEFPIPVRQGQDFSGITVEFKPFGVSLGFTPTVLGNNVISLIVEPEVSSIDPSASVAVNGLVVPGLRTRRASTTVELRDGESFAIAGLLSSDFQTTVRQLPLLGSIPILGTLFRSSGFQKGETELMIVVTPRLVAPLRPEQVRLPTDRVADPKPADMLLNGDGYQEKALKPVPGSVPADAAKGGLPPVAQWTSPFDAARPAPEPVATAATPAKEDGYAF